MWIRRLPTLSSQELAVTTTQQTHYFAEQLLQRDYFAEQLLPLVGKNAARLPNQAVTGFLSMAGLLYDNELMVVGRAPNGWDKVGVFPSELAVASSTTVYATKILDSVVGSDPCPMLWVTDYPANPSNPPNDYNTNKSAFWRVIRAVVAESGIADKDKDKKTWPSHLVWSNLYKVAPVEGGNPSKTLCDIQLPGCICLLQQEISSYLPRRLLLLTGLDWAKPFLQKIAPTFTPVSAYKYVEAIAQIPHSSGETSKVVVAAHPQGKPESIWVQEVVKAFQSDCS